jgi:hypothetical protein
LLEVAGEVLLNLGGFSGDLDGGVAGNGGFGANLADDGGDLGGVGGGDG